LLGGGLDYELRGGRRRGDHQQRRGGKRRGDARDDD
jgi:hypothetical protein